MSTTEAVGEQNAFDDTKFNSYKRVNVEIEVIKLEAEQLSEIQTELVPLQNCMQIKQELDEQDTGYEATVLYEDHEVKEEMVIGPEIIQPMSQISSMYQGDEFEAALFKCAICHQSFKKKGNLANHLKHHTDNKDNQLSWLNRKEKKYSCRYCEKQFNKKCLLANHENLHKMPPYTCSICRIQFNQKPELEAHKCVNKDTFSCELCNKNFTFRANLIRHMQLHDRGKLYHCRICNKGFKLKHYVTRHEVIHKNQPNPKLMFKCKICNKTIRKTSRSLHERVHTGAKPFKCSVCNKQFSRKGNMLQHERTHDGERPFFCKFCNTSFAHKPNLVKHINIVHSSCNDKTLLSCYMCKCRFNSVSQLFEHSCSSKGRVTCDYCKKQLANKCGLIRHIRNFHYTS